MYNFSNENGKIIFEEPYLGSMYKKVSYDQIYDEHIYMFSASSISKIFKKFGFELVNISQQITHGGSMRYIIKREKNEISHSVKKAIQYEKEKKIDKIDSCIEFKKNCEK